MANRWPLTGPPPSRGTSATGHSSAVCSFGHVGHHHWAGLPEYVSEHLTLVYVRHAPFFSSSSSSSHVSVCLPTALLLCCDGKPAPGAYPLPVTEEDVRKRHHGQRHKAHETRSPLESQGLVHLDAKQGERGCIPSKHPVSVTT
jgi:hypothetical protein